MKLILEDEELEEVLITDIVKTEDKGIVIPDKVGDRGKGKEELEKELIAIDALMYGPSKAAEIHGVPQSSASKYADGLDIKDEDSKATILGARHKIADAAISKLMQSLNLFNPEDIEKPMDHVRAAKDLASVVEKVTNKDKDSDRAVHLHLHAPRQRAEKEYETIDV